jgi:glycosyltransferase involved in cell wall biosynthesis
MKILSLNQSTFDEEPLWRQCVTSISDIDHDWRSKSLLRRVFSLLSIAGDFDVVLFHQDNRLAALFSLASRLKRRAPVFVYQGYEFDISRGVFSSKNLRTSVSNLASRLVHRLVLKRVALAVVHTTAEIRLYAKFFNVPEQKFVFVPYFHYGHDPAAILIDTEVENTRVLAIGRHRDFDCFIQAAKDAAWTKVIVTGAYDRETLQGKVPNDFHVYSEVSREEYREQIARASVVVLPLYDNCWQRSLGHIAMFEAILKRRPIVAARTFQLQDYASDHEILYYRPGDAADLRTQVNRLLSDEALRRRLTENAHNRLVAEFTRQKYILSLLEVCRRALKRRAESESSLAIGDTTYDPQV